METQTRFDLNVSIEGWRQELAVQVNLTPEVRCELETHLRDAIAGFQQRGLNDEESFWLAHRRAGQPVELAKEFVKADPAIIWREHALWAVAGILFTIIWGAISSFLFSIFTATPHPNQSSRYIASVFRALLCVLPVVWVTILFARGRMNKTLSTLAFLFRSRLRLGTTLTMLVILTYSLEVTGLWWNITTTGEMAPGEVFRFAFGMLLQIIVPLALVCLFIWLFPPKGKKSFKRHWPNTSL